MELSYFCMTGAKLFLYDRSYFIVNQYLRRKRARKWIRIQPVCSNNPREHGAAGKDTHYTGIGGQGGGGGPQAPVLRAFCSLFTFIHIITPFGWRRVYVALVHG